MKLTLAAAMCFLAVGLAGCAPSQGSIETAIAKTHQASIADTPIASPTSAFTATPTELPRPTRTTRPTITPRPTVTPRPTWTRTPVPSPTLIPDPVLLTGTGDAVVDVDNPFSAGVVHITGNASGRYFSVESYGAGNERYELLVNTTDPYDGYRPLDLLTGQHTVRFVVTANGDWAIELLPFSLARIVNVPGTVSGSGDDVLVIGAGSVDTAQIDGNAEGRYFAVISYSTTTGRDLLVNATEPYSGRVLFRPGVRLVEVIASGEWTIEFED